MEKQLYFEEIDQAYVRLTGKALEERLLELLEQNGREYGRDSAFYASMLSELGGYYRSQARYEESADRFQQARLYWREVGLPAFGVDCPQVLDRAAIGLVGEGSECFGFDDELSRDHDWGPGFCVWLSREDMARFGEQAGAVYRALPEEFMGFRRLRPSYLSAGRVGVLETGLFYTRFLGLDRPPQTLDQWRRLPESGLSAATNGAV